MSKQAEAIANGAPAPLAWTRLSRRSKAGSRPERAANRSLAIGISVLVLFALLGIFAPLIGRYDPLYQDLTQQLAGPSAEHWLGTDHLGRDVWARLIFSIRIDLPTAIAAVGVPVVFGTTLGLVAGYYGRYVGGFIMRVGEVVLAFPFMVLVIALVFVMGAGVSSILFTFALVGWVPYMIIVRGKVLSEKNSEYILAARSLGYSQRRIILRHLLPNVITQVIVYAMSDIVGTITAIVALGFLGLGISPPTPEWGVMIGDGTPFLTTHPMIAAAPGIAVIIIGFALSLIGDGLADRLRSE